MQAPDVAMEDENTLYVPPPNTMGPTNLETSTPDDGAETPRPFKRVRANEALNPPFQTTTKRAGKRPLTHATQAIQGEQAKEPPAGRLTFSFAFPPNTPPFGPTQLGVPHPQREQVRLIPAVSAPIVVPPGSTTQYTRQAVRQTSPHLEYCPPSPSPQRDPDQLAMEVEEGQLPGDTHDQMSPVQASTNWQRLHSAALNGEISGHAGPSAPRSPSLHPDGGAILPDGTYVRLTDIRFPVVGPPAHIVNREGQPREHATPVRGREETAPPQGPHHARGAPPPYPPPVQQEGAPAQQAPQQQAPQAPPLGPQANGAPLPPLNVDLQNLVVRHRALPGGGRLTDRPYPLPRPHEHGEANLQPPLDILHTPEPSGGFYRVRRNHSEALMAGVPKSKVRFWDGLDPKTRMIAEIFLGDPVREGESFQATQPLKELLEEISGRSDFIIVHTEILGDHPPFDPENVHSRPPRTVLIGNYVAELVYSLVRIQTVSTPKITANFYPADLRRDDFLGRITGFVHNIDNSIPRIITDKFLSDPVRTTIAKYTSRNPHRNHEPPEIAVQRITDSLRVRVEALPPNGQLAAFVYIDTPADTTDGEESWRKEMNALKWDSVENGTGVMRPVGPCRGCNSSEHSAHHCPFPDTPGWFGPIPPEKANPERGIATTRGPDTRERGRGRGRGFRGRF